MNNIGVKPLVALMEHKMEAKVLRVWLGSVGVNKAR
jgi:hypothetical protein